MPWALLMAHIDMYDRQDAEDRIAALNAAAAAFGGVNADSVRELERRARGSTTKAPRRYASPIDVARGIGAPVKVGDD